MKNRYNFIFGAVYHIYGHPGLTLIGIDEFYKYM